MSGIDLLGHRDAGVRILRKIVVSLAIGALAYLITALSEQTEIWSITLSVFIGGVTLVVQFLIEFETRLAKVETANEGHAARVEQMVEDGFAKINDATELFGLVEASAMPTDIVIQLVRHATLVGREPPLAFHLAQSEIDRLSRFLRELSEREAAVYHGEDRDWLLALTQLARSSIDATSLTTVDASGTSTDDGFWASDLGQRYLGAQQAAIERRVAVRRLFIATQPGVTTADPDFSEVWKLHRDHGVQVRVLDWDGVPARLRGRVTDFVLFDRAISYVTERASETKGASRPVLLRSTLELEAARVEVRIRDFEEFWDSAQVLP